MATALPPGFRFHPTDVELVCYYLKKKVMGKPFQFEAISEVELYKFAPWDLPEKSRLCSKDLEWYFFCPRDKKYPNGSRRNRSTDIGYWKTTGKDRPITHNCRTIGMKKTLIFHVGKPPKGERTDWVMYEYRMEDKQLVDTGILQDTYVLCKIFKKSGPGPKIGEQYGAPFSEEDWEEDTTAECSFSIPHLSSPRPMVMQSVSVDPVCEQPINNSVEVLSSDHNFTDVDGMLLADLADFLNSAPIIENAITEMTESVIMQKNIGETSFVEAEGIYGELDNLSALEMVTADFYYPDTFINESALHPMLSEPDGDQYLELNDLFFPGEFVPSEVVEAHGLFPQYSTENTFNVYDPIHYMDNAVNTNTMSGSLDAVPQLTSEQQSELQVHLIPASELRTLQCPRCFFHSKNLLEHEDTVCFSESRIASFLCAYCYSSVEGNNKQR